MAAGLAAAPPASPRTALCLRREDSPWVWRRGAHQGDLLRPLIQQGVSSLTIHARVLWRYVPLTGNRITDISNPGRGPGRL